MRDGTDPSSLHPNPNSTVHYTDDRDDSRTCGRAIWPQRNCPRNQDHPGKHGLLRQIRGPRHGDQPTTKENNNNKPGESPKKPLLDKKGKPIIEEEPPLIIPPPIKESKEKLLYKKHYNKKIHKKVYIKNHNKN